MPAATEPALPDWLAQEMATVPDADAFAGVDELAAESKALAAAHPEVLTERVVGRSAGGVPLVGLTVDGGAGSRHALVFGLPHPHEVVGGMTAVHLARRLAEDTGLRRRLGLTWHLIPVIDPDGMRLNEGWLRGPLTRERYFRHFFRQAFVEQIDWNFPVGGESGCPPGHRRPPETCALIELIDRHRPVLMASLHNAELGNLYYYLGRDERPLIEVLQRIPPALGMQLYRGLPEAGWSHRLTHGVYRSPDIRDSVAYERAAGRRVTDPTGNSSCAYAARHGALTLIVEVPYWRDPRTADVRDSGVPIAVAMADGGRRMAELGRVLDSALSAADELSTADELVAANSPVRRAARHFARASTAEAVDAARQAAGLPADRTATTAELASIGDTVHQYRLRNSSLVLRALDEEVDNRNPHPRLQAIRAELAERHAGWAAEASDDAAAAGVVRNRIGAMVAAQYGSILASAQHLATRSGRQPGPRRAY